MSDYLTKQAILERFRFCSYRKERPIEGALSSVAHNSLCGDTVTLSLIICDHVIANIGFQAAGCVISQVSASLFCERAHGASLPELVSLDGSDIVSLLDITLGPTRIKCATLVLDAFQSVYEQYCRENAKNA